MKLAATSFVLLVLQLALVSSIAAKYLYQRLTCPRVWTRTAAYDPQMVMRGRYLSLRVTVDGCGRITPPPPLKSDAKNPHTRSNWMIFSLSDRYSVQLAVEGNRLVAIPRSGPREKTDTGPVSNESAEENVLLAPPGASCSALQLQAPVDFYIAEHATSPLPLQPGQELWVEVTIPPKGPPRPIQLALKRSNQWKPLAFQQKPRNTPHSSVILSEAQRSRRTCVSFPCIQPRRGLRRQAAAPSYRPLNGCTAAGCAAPVWPARIAAT